jgi:flagellar basal-body rod protein FlgF
MIDRMVFTAMAGARNAVDQLAVTTNNLAHAATPGFREQLAAFLAVPVLGDGARTRVSSVDTTPGFSSVGGRIEQTGNPMDLALEGDGWFSVQRADGSTAYTRTGRMVLDNQGVLRTAGGAALQGENGNLRLPAGTLPEVGGDGVVYARREGEVTGTRVGRLRIVRADPGALDRGVDGLYESRRPPALADSAAVRVRQGASEGSNVSASDAMVRMIAQTRLFDLSMQLVKSADQNARTANQLISAAR